MIFSLISFAFAADLKPLVLIPGLYGSPLFGQATDEYQTQWYCPSFKTRYKVWVDLKLVIPPIYNCLFQMLTVRYDVTTDKLASQVGFTMSIDDFGGSGGIEYVDSSFFDWHFFESFHSFAEFLRNKGYEFKKNLFGCPYDWRFGMAGLVDTLFPMIKELVEHAYAINGNEKVTLLGYSLGGYVSQHFLAVYTTPDWKNKHIRRVVFLAPAFGGSGDTLVPAWTHRFPLVNFLTSDQITAALTTMPVLHALFPNHVVFGGQPLVIGPDGATVCTAENWGDFLNDHGKFTNEGYIIFKKNLWFNQHKLEDPGVPVTFIYNSGIATDFTLHFGDGFDQDPTQVDTIPGDGTVPAQGIHWAIKTWSDVNPSVTFTDFQNPDKDWNHGGMGKSDVVCQLIYEAAVEDVKQGLIIKELPHYTKLGEGKWVARSDIKPGKTIVITDKAQKQAVFKQFEEIQLKGRGSRKLTDQERGIRSK